MNNSQSVGFFSILSIFYSWKSQYSNHGYESHNQVILCGDAILITERLYSVSEPIKTLKEYPLVLTTSFLWYKSEDIIKKNAISKISVNSNCHCSIDYCVKLILGHKNLWCSSFMRKRFLPIPLNFLKENYKKGQKDSFEIFETAFNMKSVSMPLTYCSQLFYL